MSDEPSTMDVGLVTSVPESEAAAAPPDDPEPEPKPLPTPQPTPQPVPTQEPTPAPMPEPSSTPRAAPPPPEQRPTPVATKANRTPYSARRTNHPASQNAASRPSSNTGGINGPHGARPRYRSNPRPDYPPDARRNRQEGLVIVSVEVAADGRAISTSLVKSSGFPMLDQAAVQAVRRWTFEPATSAGLPVASRVDVPVRFHLDQR